MDNNSEIIYHGSYIKIEFPTIHQSKYPKDFSFGFYCTLIKEEAENLAINFNTPVVNIYKLTNLNALNIKIFKNYNDEWLEFVMNCRNGKTHNYDVVIGPMADDSIYDYIEAYTQRQMNTKKFFQSMNLKYPNHQISFHTIKALNCINFIKSYQL